MFALLCSLRRGLGVLLSVMVSVTACDRATTAAEPPAASAHRIVIQQGGHRRVYYVTSNLSPRDRLAVYELERTENELTYVQELQQLKHQYLQSERSLEPWRRYVQERLYGTQIRSGSYNTGSVNYLPNGIYGVPGTVEYNGFFFPYPYGYGYGWGAYASLGGWWSSETQSLQFGMGDEGRLKEAFASVLARQSLPEYAAAVARDYEAAVARAAASPVLSRVLGLPASAAPAPAAEPTFTKGHKATIWIGKEKYVGTIKEDRPAWVILQTDQAEVAVRKSEI